MSDDTAQHTALPPGLTAEAAFAACDGPADQQRRELGMVISACRRHESSAPAGWDSTACWLLRCEAEKLQNVRVICDDAVQVLQRRVADESLD